MAQILKLGYFSPSFRKMIFTFAITLKWKYMQLCTLKPQKFQVIGFMKAKLKIINTRFEQSKVPINQVIK